MKVGETYRQFIKDNLLLAVTLSGVCVGAALGFVLREFDLSEDTILLISYPGEIFMRILKLVILPLVVSSLISGTASLNARLNGRIAMRTLTYFILTSALNAFLGIMFSVIIHPGNEDTKIQTQNVMNVKHVSVMDSFLDVGRNIFPDNIFQAFFQQTYTTYVPTTVHVINDTNETYQYTSDAENLTTTYTRTLSLRYGTNNIGIISFCLVFGTILGTLESKSSLVVIDMFKAIYEVVMKVMGAIMWLTPLGICSVICGKVLSVSNIAVIVSQLGWFILTVIIGILFYQFTILQLIYFLFLKKNPFKFYLALTPATLTAFATASTAAALPVTFNCMDERIKADQRISRFVLPIGCSINMDGTALFLSSATVFIAQMNGFDLDMGQLATIWLVSTAGSMSSASVPSAALVLMLMVLSSIGCPTEDVSLLFVVDWLVDRFRTTNNMLGDCYCAAVVEHLSKAELSSSTENIVLNSDMELSPKHSLQQVVISIPNGVINKMDHDI